jgi:hypothetical protein
MKFTFFTDALTALVLLAQQFPGQKKKLWRCEKCRLWLGALDLTNGLVAEGSFEEVAEYDHDPYQGRFLVGYHMVLTGKKIMERHRIKCEECGFVNVRHRRR